MKFMIEEMMKLTNVNPRQEKHGDEDFLAVDLSVNAIFDADDIQSLLEGHKPVDMEAFKATFWDADGKPIAEHQIKLASVLEKQRVTITKPGDSVLLQSEVTTVKGFNAGFNHDTTVDLSFKIQAAKTDGLSIGRLSEYINHDVLVVIEQPQQELDMGGTDDPDNEPE